MDLTTDYLGLKLRNPLVPGASPLADNLDTVRRLEDAGAAAITMRSLFEEQLRMEEAAAEQLQQRQEEAFSDAVAALPGLARFAMGLDEHLEQIRRIKEATKLPVIGSLNGVTAEGWLRYGRLIEQAGADALELNVYEVATDPEQTAERVEARVVEMLRTVKRGLRIPVAVKLSPYYTALANFAVRLEAEGADGLVLFNRFYQPDIEVEDREVSHWIELSDASELRLRLRWLAILSPRLRGSLAASGGVHNHLGAIKAVMAGADAVQMVSALLEHGPDYLKVVLDRMVEWLEQHNYHSLEPLHGCMDLSRMPDTRIYERVNYLEVLHSWRADPAE